MFKLEKVGALYIVTSLCNINVVTCFMTAAIRGPGKVYLCHNSKLVVHTGGDRAWLDCWLNACDCSGC